MEAPATLEGFRVGVTADRRGDDQVVLLGRLGVEAVRGPVLQTDREPPGPRLRAVTEALLAAPPDYLVANTGFGVRLWWERAGRWGLDGALTAAIADRRIVARGPKAAGALRSLGLPIWWRAPTEQLEAVGDRLVEHGVRGARVALQLDGDDRQRLAARLEAAGASVVEVPVYRWELPADAGPAVSLVREICAGGIDAVTFTAGPAVRQLVELADADGRASELLDACNRTVAVVCVGPVCAAVAKEEGMLAPVVPDHWRLGAMVTRVGEVLAERRIERHAGGAAFVVQGGLAWVDGQRAVLALPARRALALLSSAGGAVVPADVLGPEGIGALVDLRAGLGRSAEWLEVTAGGARLRPQAGVVART